MIDENKFSQYGFEREEILGITIHESGNESMNAQQLHDWLNDECKTNEGWAYICDDTQTIQALPDNWAIYHTGKGIDWGCLYTIPIMICNSLNDEKYELAVDRAIDLIHELMNKYGISEERIFFHNDFNDKAYCPHILMDRYGSARRFIIERI